MPEDAESMIARNTDASGSSNALGHVCGVKTPMEFLALSRLLHSAFRILFPRILQECQ